MFDFGLRIREEREKVHMTQEALGRRVGRSKPVISSYENNLKLPPLDVLIAMAGVFNCSLDYLVGIDKAEMLSLSGLTKPQKELLSTILIEMKDTSRRANGLSVRQQQILSALMQEFSKK